MIPKIIHYCWFGNNPKTNLIKRCIKSWREKCPDYQIIEWNESNFNVNQCNFTKDAYSIGKWAFVSDYARFQILNNIGGVYLDTDVELFKSLNDFLNYKMFTGFESYNRVNPGLIWGSEKETRLVDEILNVYRNKDFFDSNGIPVLETVVDIVTKILVQKGLQLDGKKQCVDDLMIFPEDFFSPKSYFTGKETITHNSYTIHHFAASWKPWYVNFEKRTWEFFGLKDKIILSRIKRKIKRLYITLGKTSS
ncbi:MAG: glycosyl transferase [Fibrobacter sp.]|nr:glycosyl transferase [Fibrobacter sp.]